MGIRKLLLAIWALACVSALSIVLVGQRPAEAVIGFGWVMIMLTFPSGLLVLMAWGAVDVLAERFFGEESPAPGVGFSYLGFFSSLPATYSGSSLSRRSLDV